MDEDGFFLPQSQGSPKSRPGLARRAGGDSGENFLLTALDQTKHGLILLDREKRVKLITKPAAQLLGMPPGKTAFGLPVMRLIAESRALDQAAQQVLASCFGANATISRDALISLPTQGRNPARVVSIDLRAIRHRGFIATLNDVTQSQATQDWLLEHAATDPITGLWNRQHFMLMLRDHLEGGAPKPATLLLLNLRRFRHVNETLGTSAGDQVLRIIAARLQSLLREDDMIARCAGNEFAILAGGVNDAALATALAERLTAIAATPLVIDDHKIEISAAIGFARAPQDAHTADALLDQAALALAAAQTANTDPNSAGVRAFEPVLDEQARTRRALEQDLRLALAHGEFELFYQPQIELQSHHVTGFEALIRWRHPERGLVPPVMFIPIAEEMGLIGAIGAWVVRQACKAATLWPKDITVAVNASPLQVEASGFDCVVRDALEAAGLPGYRLEVEVTENLLLHDCGSVYATLHALREAGVRLVLDDFGTGFASLTQLSRFHFDKLKIDRSFVSGAGNATEHSAIVRAIAALGASLGIPTTAEGVETIMQLDQIRKDGCTSVQGYYFSKPVPESEIPALLAKLGQYAPAQD
jgi:diguanylate cyclase (GGDEF)-like protein